MWGFMKMNKLTVVVPVFNNLKITDDFFSTILENTIIPTEIILIDNGSIDKYYKLVRKYKHLNINYIRNETNKGVNSAWNYGIKNSKTPFISILNNDLLLNKYFFQKILESMDDLTVGIVSPSIIKSKSGVKKSSDSPVVLKIQKRLRGCAFTIRKEVTDKMVPIPEELKTYCGDDYLALNTFRLGYKNAIMTNNFVFHYGGRTVHEVYGTDKRKTPRINEKEIFKSYMEQNE